MINAFAVPALVRVKLVATPESDDWSYKVKAMFLPVVVAMVFPPL
jgi:hypothetical protein